MYDIEDIPISLPYRTFVLALQGVSSYESDTSKSHPELVEGRLLRFSRQKPLEIILSPSKGDFKLVALRCVG